jgi:hypothetical protein
MICQWTSLILCLMVKKANFPRPHTTKAIVHNATLITCSDNQITRSRMFDNQDDACEIICRQKMRFPYFARMKRSFVYSAVTQFDTTNTSNGSTSFDGAGSGVIFGVFSFSCGGLRFVSPGVPLLFSGRVLVFQNTIVASNVTRWLRSETRVWIGNKQARTFLPQYRHMKERGKS